MKQLVTIAAFRTLPECFFFFLDCWIPVEYLLNILRTFFVSCVISWETEQLCYSEKFDKHGSVPLASQVLANACAICWSFACNKGEPNTRWLLDLVMTSEDETCQAGTGSLAEMTPLTSLSLGLVSLPVTLRYTIHTTDYMKIREKRENMNISTVQSNHLCKTDTSI